MTITAFFVSTGNEASRLIKTLRYEIDGNYIPAPGIKMRDGRNFSKDFGMDSAVVIFNDTAFNALGWKESAVGQTIARANNGL